MERQIEGVIEFGVVESIQLYTTVLTISNDILSLTHQTHIELNECFELK